MNQGVGVLRSLPIFRDARGKELMTDPVAAADGTVYEPIAPTFSLSTGDLREFFPVQPVQVESGRNVSLWVGD